MWVNRVVVFLLGLGAILMVVDQNVNVYKMVLTYGWAVLGVGGIVLLRSIRRQGCR